MAVDVLLGNESGAVLGVITSTAAFLGLASLLEFFIKMACKAGGFAKRIVNPFSPAYNSGHGTQENRQLTFCSKKVRPRFTSDYCQYVRRYKF